MKKYFKMHIKTKLEYKMSFILTLISQLFVLLGDIFVVYSLFNKFGNLKDFSLEECFLSFSIVQLGYYLAEFLFRGFDQFPKLIRKGNLDLLLIRPENLFIQILGSEIGLTKITRVLGSLFVLIYAVINCQMSFDILRILVLILTVISSLIFFSSINILGATLSFFVVEGLEIINVLSSGSREIGQFPMGIYSKRVLKFFTFVLPLACLNYYPVMFILKRSNSIIYALCPFITIIIFIVSILLFNLGLHKYKSTGS